MPPMSQGLLFRLSMGACLSAWRLPTQKLPGTTSRRAIRLRDGHSECGLTRNECFGLVH